MDLQPTPEHHERDNTKLPSNPDTPCQPAIKYMVLRTVLIHMGSLQICILQLLCITECLLCKCPTTSMLDQETNQIPVHL